MTAIASLLVILALSFLITRLATLALTLTGVSRDLARLQSVSAFTGVGFTTTESEKIVTHPVRRRILILLMIVGNAGIVTAIASLILSFTGVEAAGQGAARLLGLAAGVGALWWLALSPWAERGLDRVMRWALQRWTRLRAVDFAELLDLSGEYQVRELSVEGRDWLADKALDELRLLDEGIFVLGIHRPDGDYLGVPRGETSLEAGDRVVLYGRQGDLAELDERVAGRSGDAAHERGRRQLSAERDSQRQRDAERRRPGDGPSAAEDGDEV